ncbi:2Fe-2S iron-sulfur cluster-binding protein [Alicyclobacillus macrosporangiidus]|uniref:2Fe-2S iron-sulfur cluster-binding protein n=1 Tax=Alicyclobacillus macrosporangiidus TaxID=392015 RepID=UPI0004971348|nr:2Fe-2S iron-sulfur cluster-binding protein [Alicyclobacillus macrosporangiidus]
MAVVRLRVVRGNPEAGQQVAEYEVPYWQGMSVLDAVLWVRANQDPTLAARYSCRSANACKECSAQIDGKVGYMCSTKAKPDATIELAPVGGRNWVRDLVTELD